MRQSLKDKLEFYNIEEDIKKLIKDKPKLPSELEYKYQWICRNLSIFKNCFVNERTFEMLDFELLKNILKVDSIKSDLCSAGDMGMSYGATGYILSI